MSESTYELVDQGHQWAGIRDGSVIGTWNREADPEGPQGPLWQMTGLVSSRWGRTPQWVTTGSGWRAQ